MFVVQPVLPDGSCCFRSVAAALVHDVTGVRVGRGTPEGMERTARDAVANALSLWLRHVAVGALGTGRTDLYEAQLTPDGRSLDTVLRLSALALRPGHRFPVDRLRHLLRAPPPRLPGPCAPDTVIGGVPAHLHVDLRGGSLAAYCARMLRPASWGGAPELFMLATRVLRRPVAIVDAQTRRVHRLGPPAAAPRAPLLLLYSGYNHYDAVLPAAPGTVAPADRDRVPESRSPNATGR